MAGEVHGDQEHDGQQQYLGSTSIEAPYGIEGIYTYGVYYISEGFCNLGTTLGLRGLAISIFHSMGLYQRYMFPALNAA